MTEEELDPIVNKVLEENPAQVEILKKLEKRFINSLMPVVLRLTKGRGNPVIIRDILLDRFWNKL